MRLGAINCCSYVIAGLFVRPVFAIDEVTQLTQIGSQDIFSMLFESWRVFLAIGILAGLINLLAKPKNREALGIELPTQLIAQPMAFGLGIVALILVALSLTPLPTLPMLVIAEVFVLLAWTSYQKNKLQTPAMTNQELQQQNRVNAVSRSSLIRLELGSALLSLASIEEERNLVDQLASLRASLFDTFGITLPSIHIKDDLRLPANTYRIYLRGGVIGEGVVYKDRCMVINENEAETELDGIQEKDPVFGLPVLWISKEVRNAVGELFVQAMDPVSVVMTHISSVVEKHAAELLTREEVSVMVNELRSTSPRLVDGVIGKTITLARFHRILQSLLEEKVSVKDLNTIIETASDSANCTLEESVEQIREALRRQICAKVSSPDALGGQVIRCVELPEETEVAIAKEELSQEQIAEALQTAAAPLLSEGLPIVVVSSAKSRKTFRKQIECEKDVVVLSRNEIVPEVDLQVVGSMQPVMQTPRTARPRSQEDDTIKTVAFAKTLLGQTSITHSIEDRLELGIAEIRSLVGEVLEGHSTNRLPPKLASAHRDLVSKGVDDALATEIVQFTDIDSSMSKDEMLRKLNQAMLRRMPRTVAPPKRDSSDPTVIALVGPTGVGKTTTIAKLGTKFGLQQGRSIALITADTYRIAAVDQLQQYADLFNASLSIAGTLEQMEEAIDRCRGADIVLIDTAGRSAIDGGRIQETADILQIANPDEIHLVLSAATSMAATKKAVEGFRPMRYDRIIVSKLDEVSSPGEMVSSLCCIDKPMSWFTNGQDISAHLDLARPTKLVESMWGEQQPITC